MIRLRNLTKHFRQGENEVRGLDGVDLDVARGEFLTIMGASGSGKSTLLHLVGGLDVPSPGEVTIDGRTFAAMSDDEVTVFRRRRIGFDSHAGEQVPDILRRGIATPDRTLVLVTHDERIAATGDRTIRLRDGKIVSETRHPRNGA